MKQKDIAGGFGARLAHVRELFGATQRGLSLKAELSAGHVNYLETYACAEPKQGTVAKLVEAMPGVTLEYLALGIGKTPTKRSLGL